MNDSLIPSFPGTPLRELAARCGIHVGTSLNHNLVARDPWRVLKREAHESRADFERRLQQNPPYIAVTGSQFDSVTVENALKWDHIERERGVFTWEQADRVVDFARLHRQRIRGHTLIWHRQLPAWLGDDQTPAEVHALLRDHIALTAGRYAGRIACWDVVNEPLEEDGSFRDSVWYRALGRGYVTEALHCARLADPMAKLYVNDYHVEGLCPKSDGLYALAKQLLRDGAPLDGVGFQTHLTLGQTPSDFAANLQRFADLGLDLAITELDIRVQLPADEISLVQQAAEYAAVVRTCLQIPRCRELTFWGVTDGLSWIPDEHPGFGAASLFDEAYAPKPAFYAVAQALRDAGSQAERERKVTVPTTTPVSTRPATAT